MCLHKQHFEAFNNIVVIIDTLKVKVWQHFFDYYFV